MSAFIVSTSTIQAIVTFAVVTLDDIPPIPKQPRSTSRSDQALHTAIGQQLTEENYKSVNHRYQRADPTPMYCHEHRYFGQVDAGTVRLLTPIDIIKLCHCLDYQSCEHDGWKTSWSKEFLQDVQSAAARLITTRNPRPVDTDLPGYDDAPWGLYD